MKSNPRYILNLKYMKSNPKYILNPKYTEKATPTNPIHTSDHTHIRSAQHLSSPRTKTISHITPHAGNPPTPRTCTTLNRVADEYDIEQDMFDRPDTYIASARHFICSGCMRITCKLGWKEKVWMRGKGKVGSRFSSRACL
ncbi:hypothetical protein EYC80_005143 [Monilinia laxa]|uniref:Uncharacterized protein n=1 Tax=Monilinia laxa TaxID=61186 RepID=A0A5N6KJA2_MONLA|nr:hypothetical protein EYC80_005143 [Monilinia laxa]